MRGDVPLPPDWLQIQGQMTSTLTTNADGSVWGATLVSGQSGAPVDVTPSIIPTVTLVPNDYTFTNQASLLGKFTTGRGCQPRR